MGTPVRRRGFLTGLTAATAVGAVGAGLPAAPAQAADSAEEGRPMARRPSDRKAALEVRAEFLHAWQGYRRLAWGRDELMPVAGKGRDFFAAGHPVGLTIVESLDTLYLMELDDELDAAVRWCEQQLDFDIDAPFQMFETVIRMLGGLLAGYHATGNRKLLDLARDLGDRLLPAFTKSPTGIPYRHVNLRTGAVSGSTNYLAEIGTNITEFGDLSKLTGDDRYLRAGMRAYEAVISRRSKLDLLGTTLNVETGQWTDTVSKLDPPVDSFYEYLWDGWHLLRDRQLLDWYQLLTKAVIRHQLERHDGRVWFRHVDYTTGKPVARTQSELTAFYAGLLAEDGVHGRLGAEYHDSWAAVVARYPLLPEGIDYTTLKALPDQKGNQLRPEYVDGAFFLWIATGQEKYRQRSWDYFQRVRTHCRVANGYTIATDVTVSPVKLGDLSAAYWFSENMKYYWLMFAESARFDYRNHYLSTEGNVLRGLRR